MDFFSRHGSLSYNDAFTIQDCSKKEDSALHLLRGKVRRKLSDAEDSVVNPGSTVS